jgi:RHS repeat-associated protein
MASPKKNALYDGMERELRASVCFGTRLKNKRGHLGVGVDDAATGLTHIGAREYDQASGRFLSADPIIGFARPSASTTPIPNSWRPSAS